MNRIPNPGNYPEAELILQRSDFADDLIGQSAFNRILKLWNIHPRNWPHIQKIRITFEKRAVEVWNRNDTKILI